ncbi:Programmed cell death protein 6 [Leucoagaricus sp. SymC.cos]|nr:Programmed cell death protein 6 [Leucoagaricus sp. SymC.cos]
MGVCDQGYGGGFSPSNQALGPPPGADPQLWLWCTTVDTDRSGHITAEELRMCAHQHTCIRSSQLISVVVLWPLETRQDILVHDNEANPCLTASQDRQNVFKHFDRDRPGSNDGPELQQALTQFGFNTSPIVIELVRKNYDIKASGQHLPGQVPGISFDRFVRACVVVKQLTESFQRLDTDTDEWIQISYDQFMQTVLNLP